MDDDSLRGFINRVFDEAKRTAVGIGMRFVVHATALACWAWAGAAHGFSFWSYIGLICLVPRGISATASWVLPTAVGAAQTALLIGQGMPPGVALFFGGLQTWIQRLFDQKGRIGWEWIAAPLVCLGVGFLAEQAPYAVFGAFAVAGAAAQVLYGFFRLSPQLRGRLAGLQKALRLRLEDRTLPTPLQAPLRRLVGQLGVYHTRCKRPGKEALPLAKAADDILAQLMRLKNRALPESWDASAGRTFTAVDKLNEELHTRLAAMGPLPVEEDLPRDPLERFYASGLDLARKREGLPEALHRQVDGIVTGVERIIACMRSDPADIAPGTRFLNRYLPAAHRVVDEYARLASAGGEQARVSAQAEEVLERLAQAFAAEHGRLLENDTMSLSAELKVLDKLLQMDGK